jgi:hypothetical protein
MRCRVLLLASLVMAVLVTPASAEDEVIVRSKEKPYKGVIKSESPRGVIVTGVKEPIPAEDVVDILYDVTR